ncbi:MAG: nuclear transport factor 2 family protein [Bacteroidales bacterium]
MKLAKESFIEIIKAIDLRDWEIAKGFLADQITMDYASFTKEAPHTVTSEELIDSWKALLPGFDHTQHQLSNFLCYEEVDLAHIQCYVSALHFIADQPDPLWTVIGTYDIKMYRDIHFKWRITSWVFNYKFQSGNLKLKEIALENVKLKM